MREGYSKRTMKRLTAALSILCFIAFLSLHASAQGADGRTEALPRKGTIRKPIRKTVKSSARITKKTTARVLPSPKPLAPDLGTLSAVINESDSRVYLSSLTVPESLVFVTPRRQSSFWRMLAPGRYYLTIKKPGFFDEVRTVDVSARGRHRLAISLRPEMAVLTLGVNIADAEIDVERVGKFKGTIKKHLLKPGRYRINVKRRGYETQTVAADLTMPGGEQKISVVLKPLRIDSILAQADVLLSKGDLDGAALLVYDVLLMNAEHARANTLYGFVELRRGNASSASYFLKAISGGATVSIPAKVIFANELADVQIAINRDAIAFRSAKRAELNFRITTSNLDEFLRSAGLPAFITVKGESDFFGKVIQPNLTIYSNAALTDKTSGQVICSSARSCATDIDILFNVISAWRDIAATASRK